MTQKSAVQNILVKIASILSIVFLALGLIFMFAAYFDAEPDTPVSLLVMTFAVAAAIFSLIATNFYGYKLSRELKEAAALASQISRGEISFDFEEDAPTAAEEAGELRIALEQISDYLAQKTAIADRVAAGDFSAKVTTHSEADVFGNAFQNMIDRLRTHVQTEEERDRLHQTIHKLLSEVSEIAAGDLTVQAQVAPEMTGAIAKAINSMTKELRSLIKQVKDVTLQVGNSASAINDTTEQLARGSEAQVAQISRTTTAISGMAVQIQEVSDNSLLSAQVASDSLDNARYGKKAVQDNINAMNSIRNQVQETAKRIKKLGERSQEISQIVSLLDDLSERTGLLALNASLQAASAGESGRGFAVVAEEVERLAERSNNLTQQIANLAQTIQTETKDVVASMEETIHEVVVGSTLADKAGHALVEIEQVSNRLAGLIQSISDSAKQQARSSEDISKAMANISKVTELVQTGAIRAADSVKILVGLANELRGSVAPFKLPDEKKLQPPNAAAPESNGIYVN